MEGLRLVTGLQPVREAIRVHRSALKRVALEQKDSPTLEALGRFAADQGVPEVVRVPRTELDRWTDGGQHQGVTAWAPELTLLAVEELLADPTLLALALDGIQDPQNFGAVIRSAVGVANAAVLWGEHSSAPLSTAAGRASAGAIEHARRVSAGSQWSGSMRTRPSASASWTSRDRPSWWLATSTKAWAAASGARAPPSVGSSRAVALTL